MAESLLLAGFQAQGVFAFLALLGLRRFHTSARAPTFERGLDADLENLFPGLFLFPPLFPAKHFVGKRFYLFDGIEFSTFFLFFDQKRETPGPRAIAIPGPFRCDQQVPEFTTTYASQATELRVSWPKAGAFRCPWLPCGQ